MKRATANMPTTRAFAIVGAAKRPLRPAGVPFSIVRLRGEMNAGDSRLTGCLHAGDD